MPARPLGALPHDDGGRLILSRLITDHRLATKDPMAAADDGLGPIAAELLLDREDEVTLDEAKAALAKG